MFVEAPGRTFHPYPLAVRGDGVARSLVAATLPPWSPDSFHSTGYTADRMKVEAVALTQAAVQVDSSPANLIPGENRTVDIFERFAREAGLEVDRFSTVQGKPVLIVTLPGTNPARDAIGFVHHSDVVGVEGQWKLAEPFSGRIVRDEQGRELLVGRGSVDTKGPASQVLVAMKYLKQNGIPLSRPVKLFLFPDEEAGGTDGAYWVAQHRPEKVRDVEYWLVEGSGVLSQELLKNLPHRGPDRDLPFIAVAQKYSIPLQVELKGRFSEDEAIRKTLNGLLKLDKYLERERWTHLGDRKESKEAYRRLGKYLGGIKGWLLRNFWNSRILQRLMPPEIAAANKTDASKTDFILSSNPAGQGELQPNLKPSSATVVLDLTLPPARRPRVLQEMVQAVGPDFRLLPLPELSGGDHLVVKLVLPQENYRGVNHGAAADRRKDAIDVTNRALGRLDRYFARHGWSDRVRRLDYFTSKSERPVTGYPGDPVSTRVVLDLRVQVDDDRDRTLQEIARALGDGFTVTPLTGREDFKALVRRTSYRSPLFQAVEEVNRRFYGQDTPSLFGNSPGSNDVRHLMAVNPRSQAISFTPILITRHGPHAPDEAVPVQSLQQGAEWTVALLTSLGR